MKKINLSPDLVDWTANQLYNRTLTELNTEEHIEMLSRLAKIKSDEFAGVDYDAESNSIIVFVEND